MIKHTLAALALGALAPFHAFADLTIVRTSAPGTGPSLSQAISGSGTFQAFSTTSSNLGISDTNGVADIYVRNLTNAAIECVSKSDNGDIGNSTSTNPSTSADGRYVAFQSTASNLVAGDSNGAGITGVGTGLDIFVYDRNLATIKRVSLSPTGLQASQDCESPSIAADGSTVAFVSADPNLVAPTTGARSYIYLVTVATAGNPGSIARVPLPVAPDGAIITCKNPSLSQDGNFVAYEYEISDGGIGTGPGFFYADVYVYNRTTNQNIRITGSSATDGPLWNGQFSVNPSISGDGKLVAFESCVRLTAEKADVPQDENFIDVFVARIGESITYRLASKDTLGTLGNADSTRPAISDNGRFVSFQSAASSFDQGSNAGTATIYRKELATGGLTLVAAVEGSSAAFDSSVSADGSVVSFLSHATNLVAGDIDNNSATDAFAARFPESAEAVLAFDESGEATPMVDVTGNYQGRFPGSRKPFQADVAMDESGKIVTMGTVDGYTHPTKGDDVRVVGSLKTVNDMPTASGNGNIKGGTMDGEPIGGSGKISVPLVETATDEGSEFQGGVGSGKATVEGETYKQPATMVSVPAEPANVTKDWSISLSIYERTTAKGKTYLAAFATLYLPNGDRTQFGERKLTFNPKTGLYSSNFEKGIKLDQGSDPILVNGKKVRDRKSRVVVTQLQVEESGETRQPTGGKLRYKFLGQKGDGDLLDFF